MTEETIEAEISDVERRDQLIVHIEASTEREGQFNTIREMVKEIIE